MLSESRTKELNFFLKCLNLKSNDLGIISYGLTHPSFVNEKGMSVLCCYERLEFLGDAVLKLVVSRYLYDKFSDYDEGKLTKIRGTVVSDACIADFANNINLSGYLLIGNVDFNTNKGIPASILACAFEGLLGALYLTTDFESIETFLIAQIEDLVDDLANNRTHHNSKAILQEYTQSKTKDLPVYVVKNESGPEHNKTFEVEVFYQNELLGIGHGKTKKEAQQNAAIAACKKLGILNEQ